MTRDSKRHILGLFVFSRELTPSGDTRRSGVERTEDDALCAAVVRRRDSAEAFLARGILGQYSQRFLLFSIL